MSVFDKELVQEVDESAGYDDLGAAGSGVAEAILTVFVQLDMNYGGRERKIITLLCSGLLVESRLVVL